MAPRTDCDHRPDRSALGVLPDWPGGSADSEGMTMATNVVFAVYGALRGGGQDNTEAKIVTNALQQRLSAAPNGVVKIDNSNMGGDPAPGELKHFGAIVEIDGTRRPFACVEGQTIDFT